MRACHHPILLIIFHFYFHFNPLGPILSYSYSPYSLMPAPFLKAQRLWLSFCGRVDAGAQARRRAAEARAMTEAAKASGRAAASKKQKDLKFFWNASNDRSRLVGATLLQVRWTKRSSRAAALPPSTSAAIMTCIHVEEPSPSKHDLTAESITLSHTFTLHPTILEKFCY